MGLFAYILAVDLPLNRGRCIMKIIFFELVLYYGMALKEGLYFENEPQVKTFFKCKH